MTERYLSGVFLVLLGFCAMRDFKEGIIPNLYLIRGGAIRILLLLHEVSVNGIEAIKNLGLKVIIGFFLFAVSIFIRKISQDGFGMGDIKLIILMYLYLEPRIWFGAVFLSMLLGAVWAMIVLICCKGNRKIPFVPVLLAGTVFSIFSNI